MKKIFEHAADIFGGGLSLEEVIDVVRVHGGDGLGGVGPRVVLFDRNGIRVFDATNYVQHVAFAVPLSQTPPSDDAAAGAKN